MPCLLVSIITVFSNYFTDAIVIKNIATILGQGSNFCSNECPPNWDPICAQNSQGAEQEFANRCVMDVHNCQHNMDFEKIHIGSCQK